MVQGVLFARSPCDSQGRVQTNDYGWTHVAHSREYLQDAHFHGTEILICNPCTLHSPHITKLGGWGSHVKGIVSRHGAKIAIQRKCSPCEDSLVTFAMMRSAVDPHPKFCENCESGVVVRFVGPPILCMHVFCSYNCEKGTPTLVWWWYTTGVLAQEFHFVCVDTTICFQHKALYSTREQRCVEHGQ